MTNPNSRRSFLRNVGLGSLGAAALNSLPNVVGTFAASDTTGVAAAAEQAPQSALVNEYAIGNQKKPLAIAMWDFSWILCHQHLDSFENWDKTLDQLVERGYDAIRIDAMPHLVAPDAEGRVREEYFIKQKDWEPPLWGNRYSVRVRPREAILEFLPKCYERGIHVGLSTWFLNAGDRFSEEHGLFRAWESTLAFLDHNGLLDRVLYVDVLNEYPFWHGFDWLKQEMDARSDAKRFQQDKPDAHLPDADAFVRQGQFTPAQKQLFNGFLTNLLTRLKQRWPRQAFFASLDTGMPLPDIDMSACDAMDRHVWFHHHPEVGGIIGGIPGPNDVRYEVLQKSLMSFWAQNRQRMIDWITGQISEASACAAKHGIPCGNTEGWGTITWLDHPALTWDFIKESGDICVELALAHGYKFICTSNFTHPQFPGLWDDVAWHKRLTARIRG